MKNNFFDLDLIKMELMKYCYTGDLNKVKTLLEQEWDEREIYNCLVMSKEGKIHHEDKKNYDEIREILIHYSKKHFNRNELKPTDGRYAEWVMLDSNGPIVKYGGYKNGKFIGLYSY